jgi:hypothetical protein
MGRMSDLDIALTGVHRTPQSWSAPSVAFVLTDDRTLKADADLAYLYRMYPQLSVEMWCMGPGCFMGEVCT